MRGKEVQLGEIDLQDRITPAYAGKSALVGSGGRQAWDHPRVCGEKVQTLLYPDMQKGSPPRMRGKAVFQVALCIGVGITPAYAGKSGGRTRHGSCAWDHPRVCGEKTKKIP